MPLGVLRRLARAERPEQQTLGKNRRYMGVKKIIRSRRTVYKIPVIICLFFLLFPTPSYAYIDPGTGSLILQALVAGGITILIFFRNIRKRIASLFRRDRDVEKND